ncbi:DNA-binding transcriptional regulator YdaS (Cro superfamily) [Methylobacter tundripaludum]|uniref:DNA-binding transcriptional regulator YdaS (Cro superfamily) n=1 Tax=Methylobacter tundripaludum TaxID=173365 RepID=A0A2S6H593_9GAMM|nr:YdaS family helix-turn-helix protein [Methylobacter tundripaludum]PPK72652.1 DNA-binding transcriptional regulator YdaS (Cro superfamily) [Methylobacter tundripaludum]
MDKLILFFGGRVEAANAIGVSPSYISMIKSGKRKCSPALAVLVDNITNGKVSKQELRPDIWSPSIDSGAFLKKEGVESTQSNTDTAQASGQNALR